jgi:predicted ester cyclase
MEPRRRGRPRRRRCSLQGSLGTRVVGIDGFRRYVERVRTAFPDFHNQVDELIADGEKIVARLTCTGTHRGELFGIAPTGRKVTYAANAILGLNDDKIHDAWVVGDTQEVWRALRSIPAERAHPQSTD